MKRIILIQHCQSEHHLTNLTGGWTDSDLTPLGKLQAQYISQYIKGLISDKVKIFTSDLKRAKHTADIIVDNLLLPLVVDDGLREINNGVAANKTKDWAKQHRLPTLKNGFDFNYLEFEDGESWKDFYIRIEKTMQKIYSDKTECIIIVSHGCAVAYILKWWLFIASEDQISNTHFQGDAGGITLLEENRYNQRTITFFNRIDHLPNK